MNWEFAGIQIDLIKDNYLLGMDAIRWILLTENELNSISKVETKEENLRFSISTDSFCTFQCAVDRLNYLYSWAMKNVPLMSQPFGFFRLPLNTFL